MKRRQKNCILLVCSLLAFANISYSQESDVSKLLEANAQYFSPLRENVHLHLNKTTFIIGEHVWYTAYLYDQNKQEPSQATSNLHVALVDANGLQISKQLIHIKNGIGQGDFLLDNTLLDSSYFIIAWTEWMKNFEDVQPFLQEIKIINTKGDTKPANEYQPYIEIFPEGGRILSENDNTVGFKIRNRKGSQNVISSIKLVNSKGQTLVDNISVNHADEGKFRYYQKSDESYSLHVLVNNKIYIKKSLPKAASDGIKMEVSSTHPTYHTLTVIAGPGLLEKENTVYLAF